MGNINKYMSYASTEGTIHELLNGSELTRQISGNESSINLGFAVMDCTEYRGKSLANKVTDISFTYNVRLNEDTFWTQAEGAYIIYPIRAEGVTISGTSMTADTYRLITTEGKTHKISTGSKKGYDNASSWINNRSTGNMEPNEHFNLMQIINDGYYIGTQMVLEEHNGASTTKMTLHISDFKCNINYTSACYIYFKDEDVILNENNTYYTAGSTPSCSVENKSGYYFGGWQDIATQITYQPSELPATGEYDVTYKAIWAPSIYTISLDNQSADIESGDSIVYLKYNTQWQNSSDTKIQKIIIPQKTGYFFGGYYTATNGEGSQIIDNLGNINNGYLTFTTNDISLYAYWIPIVYDLVYDDGSGNQSSPISLAYDKKYKIEHFDAIFSEENYPTWNLIYKDNGATEDFIDNEPIKRTWNDRWRNEITMKDYGLNEEVSGLSSADGDKVILKAIWKAEVKKTNLSIPIRKYHQFAGWKDSSGNTYDQGDTFKFIENNSVLTAQWKKIQPRMFAGIDNIQKLFLSKDKEIKKIFVYITPENNGSGKHIEV